jgi:glycosyltransferase involved in cell wall biosynthesis
MEIKYPNVMHMTSTMLPGGAEKVAVNILNNLKAYQFTPFLMTSRDDGPLLANLSKDVVRTCLKRSLRFDLKGFLRFIRFIRHNNIHIIHAHEYTIFIGLLAKLFVPRIAVIWHNHMSSMLKLRRASPWFLLAGRAADLILTANIDLAKWTIEKIKVPSDKVRYIPNFVNSSCWQEQSSAKQASLKISRSDKRIVCVGNIKPEKDQITLLRAFSLVFEKLCNVHLILVGKNTNQAYSVMLNQVIQASGIKKHISVIGACNDVSAILAECDLAVLSSKNEAFPMALIEYGCAKLPSIATSVGQCPEILDYGRAGVLIEPNNPEHLAREMIRLLQSPRQMNRFGEALYDRVKKNYSSEQVMPLYKDLYSELLVKENSND